MPTSPSHTRNSSTGAKTKRDFDDIIEKDNNHDQSINPNSKRRRSHLPSLPSQSRAQSSPRKAKKPRNNSSTSSSVQGHKFYSHTEKETDLVKAIIELIQYYARYRPRYDQSFTAERAGVTKLNKLWDFDTVDNGKIYLKPIQKFNITEEEILFVIRKAKGELREEDWETVEKVIAYSYSENWFIMTLGGTVHDETKDNLAGTVEKAINRLLNELGAQLEFSRRTEFRIECTIDSNQETDPPTKTIIERKADVGWRKNGESYPAVLAEIEHSQRDYEGYEVIHQYLTRSPDLVVKYAFALKIGYEAGSAKGLDVTWTLYRRVIKEGNILTSEVVGKPVVLRNKKRRNSSSAVLNSNVFNLCIRQILPKRNYWDARFTSEILDAKVTVTGRQILDCVIKAEAVAQQMKNEKAASPEVPEGEGSGFIVEVRPPTEDEKSYRNWELVKTEKSDRASAERELREKKRKRSEEEEEKDWIAEEGGVAIMVGDGDSFKRTTRSMARRGGEEKEVYRKGRKGRV
ncbi:hypothetical protein BGAL_1008g00010 [Botrytis galanthina]|uniref:Uncharacterized protein n=1 Tax=Botrytis galanthina TaxID=278940 RepID=A0A4S8QL29_9HELO|nr:hypothetical protein BGAL_1008g00010 [Botrytis galanthina]